MALQKLVRAGEVLGEDSETQLAEGCEVICLLAANKATGFGDLKSRVSEIAGFCCLGFFRGFGLFFDVAC